MKEKDKCASRDKMPLRGNKCPAGDKKDKCAAHDKILSISSGCEATLSREAHSSCREAACIPARVANHIEPTADRSARNIAITTYEDCAPRGLSIAPSLPPWAVAHGYRHAGAPRPYLPQPPRPSGTPPKEGNTSYIILHTSYIKSNEQPNTMKTILSFLSPRSGIYPAASRPFIARRAFIRPRSGFIARSAFILLIALAINACSEEAMNTDTDAGKMEGIPLSDVPIAFTDPGQEKDDGLLPLSTGDRTTDNLDAMTVYAHYTGADDFDDVAASAPNFMFNQSVTKGGSGWTYAPQKYWPAQHEKVSFFAIAPGPAEENGIELITSNDSYTGYPSFTVTPPASPALQEDFCVASALNLADNTNGGKVPLHFDHVMAKVKFSAKYVSDEDLCIFIKGIKIKNVITENILRFNASSFTWDTNNENKGTYTLSAADGTLASMLSEPEGDLVGIRLEKGASTLSTAEGTLLLIPQTIPDGAKIEVTLWAGRPDMEIVQEVNMPQQTLEAGKSYNYSLAISDTEIQELFADEPVWDIDYTGNYTMFYVPADGTYKLEAWGASGTNEKTPSNGGKGAYAAGEIDLKQGQILYIYVGESTTTRKVSFNGGATGVGGTNASGTGGGATDFRLLGGTWSDASSLNARMLVAGGGGGAGHDGNNDRYGNGGAGGGLTGYDGSRNNTGAGGKGGEQTAGGAGVNVTGYASSSGSFGVGSNGSSDTNVGGGAGGYYGGSGAARQYGQAGATGGGGGSSFISGMTNCVAIDPTSITEPRAQDSNGNTAALNYNSAFGTSPTWNDNAEILFTNPSMIDGAGYEWNTGTKGTLTNMPNWNGGGTMTGNAGNGHARITLLTN